MITYWNCNLTSSIYFTWCNKMTFMNTALFSPMSVFTDCKNFRLIFQESTPTCEPFSYDEGAWSSTNIFIAFSDMSVCFRRCFDMPECLSVGFWLAPNCTYHNCVSPGTLSAGAWSMVSKDCFRGKYYLYVDEQIIWFCMCFINNYHCFLFEICTQELYVL